MGRTKSKVSSFSFDASDDDDDAVTEGVRAWQERRRKKNKVRELWVAMVGVSGVEVMLFYCASSANSTEMKVERREW